VASQSAAPQIGSSVEQCAGPVQQCPEPLVPQIPEVQASFVVQEPLACFAAHAAAELQ
jgi:hypothetical protein